MCPDPLRIEGTLRSWDDDRGFGFLESPQSADTFAHVSAFDGRPRQGERFSYVIGFTADGRTQAEEVRALRELAPPSRAPRQRADNQTKRAVSVVSLLAIPAFALLFVVLMFRWGLPGYLALLFAAGSVLTFVVYAVDKLAVRFGWRRVSEASLTFFGFIGGWPGALLAQQLLRHKTVKVSFQRQFWRSVLLNVVVLCGIAAALHYRLIPA